ncbi:MAG: type Z 30S ribosomal protein S14 [Elusimicrobiota bacterium]|jgi:small subunit ribosomal protein S14|nr:type Z 30S ribosomal protein S14 [Elusimicrobiota bacterium]
MATISAEVKMLKIQKFASRHRNRCGICGRPRGFYRDFGVCRICLRKLAHNGEIPGLTKSSW